MQNRLSRVSYSFIDLITKQLLWGRLIIALYSSAHLNTVVITQLLLVGTDCGLFAMRYMNDVDHRPMTRISGLEGSVHAIDGHTDAGLVFLVVGMSMI